MEAQNKFIELIDASEKQTNFPSLRDELIFWQKQVIELTYEQQWMIKEWGEATTEAEGTLRQVHYTLKLFRLVRNPIEVTAVRFVYGFK